MHIDSRPQPDPSAHKLSIFILIYGVHCWDIVAGRGRWGSVTWVGFISCKNGYKNSFSFLAFVAKVPHEICCCCWCTIAFKFTSPHPCSSSLTWQSFFHLLPALSTLSNCCHLKAKRTMRAKYTWNMFGSTFKRKLLLLSLPPAFPLSLSLCLFYGK